MYGRIDNICCYDYTQEIGHCDSIWDFGSIEMTYIGLSLSTPKIHVNATPDSFSIPSIGSSAIREYAVSQMDSLQEISKNLAINSPKYFRITYFDGSERYFAYNKSFYLLFSMALQYKPEPDEYVSTYINERDCSPTSRSLPHKENTYQQKKKFLSWRNVCILLLIVIGIVVCYLNSPPKMDNVVYNPTTQTTPKTELKPVSEPLSGAILYGERLTEGSEITIKASGDESYVVKLKSAAGATLYSFYVRAGDTVTVTIPAKCMYVYFASGKTWYGSRHLFGEDTFFSKDDDLIDFTQYTITYTLYPVTNGNFTQTPIDPKDF